MIRRIRIWFIVHVLLRFHDWRINRICDVLGRVADANAGREDEPPEYTRLERKYTAACARHGAALRRLAALCAIDDERAERQRLQDQWGELFNG